MSSIDKSRNKYLFKNTIIFAIGNIATKFINLFLVPLYTNCLIASEYGTADLLYTLCNFLIPLLTLNIAEAVLMFSLDKNANDKKITRIATTMLIPLVIIGAVSIPILKSLNEFSDYHLYFYAYLVTSAISQIYLVVLKGQEKLKEFTLGNVLHTALILIFSLVFLVWLKIGIGGYFLAYILANVLVSIYAIIASKTLFNLKGSKFDKKLFKKMVKYSAVLIPTTFMWWIMNFLDRAMIMGMMDASASGVYAVSYKIPTILSSVSSIFMQAWLFSAVKNNGTEDNERYTNKVFGMLTVILVGVSMILLVFIRQLYTVYVAPEYYSAWEYVPVLMIGHMFLTLSTFISTSYNVHKDSKGFLFSATIGAIVNLVLNAILIPLIGIQGAAIATTISYIAVFLYRLFDTRKYVRIHLDLKFVILVCALLVCAFSAFLDTPMNLALQLVSILIYVLVVHEEILVLLDPIKRLFIR
ncbi:polysaccharide biosynthesis C-terminal domain-containing protein [Candidatus Saccharibacteria bacterium]|nr:polysaccharide biosynthesis C-terminal domain-containing protein [Candidatus Saccharibacteria bacterium]